MDQEEELAMELTRQKGEVQEKRKASKSFADLVCPALVLVQNAEDSSEEALVVAFDKGSW